MKLATGWNWLASVAVVFAVLAIAGTGCSSSKDKTEKSKGKTPATKSAGTSAAKTLTKTDSKTDAKTTVRTEAPEKTQEPKKTEEPEKTEEPKVEEPKKTEEPKVEEPKKTEEPKVEEPKKTEEPKVEEPKKTEEPMVEEPKKTEEPKVEEPKKTEEPKVEEPKKTEEPKVEEPKKTEEPKVEEPKKTEEPAKESTAAAPAAAGPVKASAYAPAEDLDTQMDDYLKSLAKTVETEQTFKDESGNLTKDAHTMAVLALVMGLHDQESKYRAAAPALLKASQALAEVKDYEAAKKAAAGVIVALDSKEPAELKWEKVAALPELMKQVPNVHTKLKMKITGTRLKSQAKATQGYTAAIAAIAQASIVDASPAKTPEDVQKWQAFCVDMRDAAGAVNAAIRKQDRTAVDDAMVKLQTSCDDCHKVFHQAALSK